MANYSETSFIVKKYTKLQEYYSTSSTRKVFNTLANWYSCSITSYLAMKYLQKASTLRYSSVYTSCSKGYKAVDSLWDKLYFLLAAYASSSLVTCFIRKTFCGTNNLFACSLFVLFFSFGFSITSILFGTFNNIKAILLIIGLLASALLLVNKPSWTACKKNSLFWRIIAYIFD